MNVIYVDVLFIVNFIITLLLILLTAKLAKRDVSVVRLVLSSAAGGAYSLVILADDLTFFISFFGKLMAAFVIVGIAFPVKRLTVFLKGVGIFFFSNLVFLGVMVGLWFIFRPAGIVINNSTVYFDLSAKLLLLSALAAYALSVIIIRIYNKTISKKEIYSLTVFKDGKEIHLFAFADSGNNLKEPFSDYPVIIADKKLFDCRAERVIPYETVGGEGLLKGFKPDKIVISSQGKKEIVENVYIALSDQMNHKDYSAVINPKILNI